MDDSKWYMVFQNSYFEVKEKNKENGGSKFLMVQTSAGEDTSKLSRKFANLAYRRV